MTFTTEILIDDFLILIGFVVFMFIQAVAINGIFDCFRGGCTNDMVKGKICTGSIFYLIKPSFFEKYKHTNWSKNIFSCPKCMASTYGSVTFWLPVIWLFGFHPVEIFVWLIDIFSLVTINWYVYRKL